MSAVVDMILTPIAMAGKEAPFFTFPPVTTVICGTVELIKGGQIEEIPGIGQIIKYGRESVLVIVLLIVLYVKAWQYIGPKLWHLIENGKNWARNTLTEGEPDDDDYSFFPDILKIILWWGVKIFITGPLTYLLQVPIDIMSWDMESLSLDFGNLWGDPKNFYRDNCRRFVNGSYAGDFSLYEKENIDTYLRESHSGNITDRYEHSPNKYLCTHGNYCKEISDVFGKTMMGRNGSLSEDNSPTDGYVNGINISSAPRKYSACCSSYPITDCKQECSDESPLNIDFILHPTSLGFKGGVSEIAENMKNIILHPINYIEEIISVAVGSVGTLEEDIKNCIEREIYRFWKRESNKHYAVPNPDKHGFSDWGRKCPHGVENLRVIIQKEYEKRIKECIKDCKTENNQQLAIHGCNTDYMEKARRSSLRNRNDTLLSQLPREYDTDVIKESAIKRTPWKSGERPSELNNSSSYLTFDSYEASRLNASYNRGQQIVRTEELMVDGTDCSKHNLSEHELEKCFGPFRPMTPQEYPVLFYKITKDFMGSILWTLLGLFVFFIILYILCLFNPVGQASYEFNKNAGMVEGGMKSMGMNMKNLNLSKITDMVKSKIN